MLSAHSFRVCVSQALTVEKRRRHPWLAMIMDREQSMKRFVYRAGVTSFIRTYLDR